MRQAAATTIQFFRVKTISRNVIINTFFILYKLKLFTPMHKILISIRLSNIYNLRGNSIINLREVNLNEHTLFIYSQPQNLIFPLEFISSKQELESSLAYFHFV